MSQPSLVCYFARVGDLVMFTPVLNALAAQGPLELCARPWARPLLANEPYLAAIHTLAKPNTGGLWDLLAGSPRARLGRLLAERNYRRVIILDRETPEIAAWIASWAGPIPITVFPHVAQGGHGHLVDANIAAAVAAGIPVTDPHPTLTIAPAQAESAARRRAACGQRVVAIQAGSSLTHRWLRRQPNLKGLAPAQWAGLCARLLAERACDAVVFLGSGPEGREARAIQAAMPAELRAKTHDLTGAISLAELPAFLAGCAGCVSVDTGPAHIAAAVGCRLLTIFGPTDPGRFAPRGPGRIGTVIGSAACRPCHGTKLFKTCRSNVCLTGLTVEALWSAWSALDGAPTAEMGVAAIRSLEW